jgi:hypothetical protein
METTTEFRKRRKEKILAVVPEAQEAFWKVVKAHFPEIKEEELSPYDTVTFEKQCREIVASWVVSNT